MDKRPPEPSWPFETDDPLAKLAECIAYALALDAKRKAQAARHWPAKRSKRMNLP